MQSPLPKRWRVGRLAPKKGCQKERKREREKKGRCFFSCLYLNHQIKITNRLLLAGWGVQKFFQNLSVNIYIFFFTDNCCRHLFFFKDTILIAPCKTHVLCSVCLLSREGCFKPFFPTCSYLILNKTKKRSTFVLLFVWLVSTFQRWTSTMFAHLFDQWASCKRTDSSSFS